MNEIPAGLCRCGCGKSTEIAIRGRKRIGYKPGDYKPYLRNHSPHDALCRKIVKTRRRDEGRKFVQDYLKIHPCIDCGESDPIVLDFDHRDRTTKLKSIADLVSGFQANIAILTEEISKCDVRCANCHRKKTYREKAYQKP